MENYGKEKCEKEHNFQLNGLWNRMTFDKRWCTRGLTHHQINYLIR